MSMTAQGFGILLHSKGASHEVPVNQKTTPNHELLTRVRWKIDNEKYDRKD